MTSKKVDPRTEALMEFHGADGEPAALISRLCLDLLDEAGEGIPVDLEVLASFRNAHVVLVEQEQAETIHWDGRNFQIRLRSADTSGADSASAARMPSFTRGSWSPLATDRMVQASRRVGAKQRKSCVISGRLGCFYPRPPSRPRAPLRSPWTTFFDLQTNFRPVPRPPPYEP
jgi:hypothetical protein